MKNDKYSGTSTAPLKQDQSNKYLFENGNKYYKKHDYEKAADCYSKVTGQGVNKALLLRGIALREMGKPREAITCFDQIKIKIVLLMTHISN